MLTMALSEFARHLGCSPASVTRLKKAGRLVLTADGKVDVDGSLWRLAETQGGQASQADLAPPPVSAWKHPEHNFQLQRARRVTYEALTAEREARLMLAKLVDAAAVRAAANEASALILAMARAFPASVAGKIAAASDEVQTREILEDGVPDLLQTLADRLAALAEQPGTS
ncbi:MAG: hypothetical protein IPH41_10960 [Sulfuritalea sp.]|nr:hypothetical protein [Sulfuritalea sp.]